MDATPWAPGWISLMKIKAITVILITINCVNTWVHRMEGKEEMSWLEKNQGSNLESAALCSPYNTITIAIFSYYKAYQDDMNIFGICSPSLFSTA